MKMYVANCTKQKCDFNYRVSETKGIRMQTILPGNQVMLADMNMQKPEIDAILQQHQRFGMVFVDDVNRIRGYTPRIYSIDRPVPAKAIEQVMRHNTGVLVIRGREARRLAAVQAHAAIEDRLNEVAQQTQGQVQPELGELDISMEQVETPNAPFIPTDEQSTLVSEGVVVSKSADPTPGPQPGKQSNRPRRTSGGGRKRKVAA